VGRVCHRNKGSAARDIGYPLAANAAAGDTNRQIAETLFISESTAGVHVSNILGKVGVRSRTEAAAIAVRLGLDQAPD
jgi:DNA-binding NarL/FixJ family response regulator